MGDLGLAGPDHGKGGKYLVLPPGYKKDVPSGYFVIRPKTFYTWIFMRGNIKNGIEPAVNNVKENLKVYPLSEKNSPRKAEYVSMSGKYFNTIHTNDYTFYEHLNELIQYESDEMLDPETKGLFASIGIKKGQEFAPDARMKKILVDAVAIANAAARANNYYPKGDMKMVYFYTDQPTEWVMAYPAKNVFFNYDGGLNTDVRQAAIEKRVPLGKIATPRNIADGAVFLCSEMASYVTGELLVIDGGLTIDGTIREANDYLEDIP